MVLNLLEIIDECLLKIFENLSVPELGVIASTCSRLKTIARDVFSRHHKLNCLEIGIHSTEHRQQAAAILRHFGDLLTKLKVTYSHSSRDKASNTFLFNMMTMYCTKTLDRMELRHCYYLQSDDIVDAKALFRNVKELILEDSPRIHAPFLSDAKELTRLTLNGLHCAYIRRWNSIKSLSQASTVVIGER